MAIIDKCEHCGAEGVVQPTPHGYHCEQCYPQVMGQEDSDASCPVCGLVGSGLCLDCEDSPLAADA